MHGLDRKLGAVCVAHLDARCPAAIGPAEDSVELFFGSAVLGCYRRCYFSNAMGGVSSATDKERHKMESVHRLIKKSEKAYQLLNGCCWRKAVVRIMMTMECLLLSRERT
jgi:hypothetical protein